MDIVIESVKKLEKMLEQSGCDDGGVRLDVDPEIAVCRYEKGACMTADFGNKRSVFTTFDPIRACTKISFLFGAPLDTPAVRGAACAIVNVAAGFFCLARTIRPCNKESHDPCGAMLAEELGKRPVYCHGTIHSLERIHLNRTNDPEAAEIILITADGLISIGTGDLVEQYKKTKRIICAGPSTAGTARLHEIEHWCPFGTS
jgi:hypothetical protein